MKKKRIRLLLEALAQQTFPQAEMEVIIADGMSEDGTRAAIVGFQTEHPGLSVQVVDNPRRIIPAAMNAGISAAQGQFILRLDAHSIPQPDYIARCVEALQAGTAENVGGVWEIRPQMSIGSRVPLLRLQPTHWQLGMLAIVLAAGLALWIPFLWRLQTRLDRTHRSF